MRRGLLVRRCSQPSGWHAFPIRRGLNRSRRRLHARCHAAGRRLVRRTRPQCPCPSAAERSHTRLAGSRPRTAPAHPCLCHWSVRRVRERAGPRQQPCAPSAAARPKTNDRCVMPETKKTPPLDSVAALEDPKRSRSARRHGREPLVEGGADARRRSSDADSDGRQARDPSSGACGLGRLAGYPPSR